MNGTEFNLMFFQANDMINYFKKKYLYKNYYILKKGPIFQNFADLLDDETLLEIKYTCRKFKQKIEADSNLKNRANSAELKKVKEKLREYRNRDVYFIGACLENKKNRLKRKGFNDNGNINLKFKNGFSLLGGLYHNQLHMKECLKKKFGYKSTSVKQNQENQSLLKNKRPIAIIENNRIELRNDLLDNKAKKREEEIFIREISPEYIENLNKLRIIMLDDYHLKKKREQYDELLREELRQRHTREKDKSGFWIQRRKKNSEALEKFENVFKNFYFSASKKSLIFYLLLITT